jgi:hypothetical protein
MAEAFSELIQARCQPGFASLVERAARSRGMTISEWTRQAARTALALDGFDPSHIGTPDPNDSVRPSLGDTDPTDSN